MNEPPLRWRAFAGILLVTAGSIAALWIAIPPSYLTNDDVTIRLAAEGRSVPRQQPTGFVLLAHAGLGWLVAWTQRAVPAWPVWDLVVAGTLAIALATILAVCARAIGKGWLPVTTGAATIVAAAVPLLAGVQFTISGTLAGAAAALLAIEGAPAGSPDRTRRLLAAFALAVTGFLIRPMAATAGALAVAVLLVPAALVSGRAGRRLKVIAGTAAAALALSAGAQFSDALLYRSSPAWHEYYQYQWLMLQLSEWSGQLPAAGLEAVRAAAGWTVNDWTMLTGSLGVDPDLHGFDRVSRAYEARTAEVGTRDVIAAVAARAADTTLPDLQRLAAASAPVLAATLIASAAYGGVRGSALWVLTLVSFGALCIGIEAAFKELPFRVFAPLQVCFAAATVIGASVTRRPLRPLGAVVAASAVLALTLHQAGAVAAALAADAAHAAQVAREVGRLHALSPSLLVLHGDAFPAEHWWRPFRPSPAWPSTVRLGENNHYPPLQQFLSTTGRQPLLRAVCQDPSILVATREHQLEPVTIYLREHFGTGVTWERLFDESFSLWRCTPVRHVPAGGGPAS